MKKGTGQEKRWKIYWVIFSTTSCMPRKNRSVCNWHLFQSKYPKQSPCTQYISVFFFVSLSSFLPIFYLNLRSHLHKSVHRRLSDSSPFPLIGWLKVFPYLKHSSKMLSVPNWFFFPKVSPGIRCLVWKYSQLYAIFWDILGSLIQNCKRLLISHSI